MRDAIRGSARWWRCLHDVLCGQGHNLGPTLGKCANQKAIGHDADRLASRFYDDDGRDVPIHEQPENVVEVAPGQHGFNPVTFEVEYVVDSHGLVPFGGLDETM